MSVPANSGQQATRVLLAIPHARTRAAIRSALEARGDVVVTAEAASPLQVVTAARAAQAQVVLIDLALLPSGTSPTLTALVQALGGIHVVTLGLRDAVAFARASLRAGAVAHLATDASPEEYRQVIRRAAT